MTSESSKNPSTNGANYQHSGTEPLRSFPESEHASIIPDPTSGTKTTPGMVKQSDGMANLRADQKDINSKIPSTPSGKSDIPASVAKFSGKGV